MRYPISAKWQSLATTGLVNTFTYSGAAAKSIVRRANRLSVSELRLTTCFAAVCLFRLPLLVEGGESSSGAAAAAAVVRLLLMRCHSVIRTTSIIGLFLFLRRGKLIEQRAFPAAADAQRDDTAHFDAKGTRSRRITTAAAIATGTFTAATSAWVSQQRQRWRNC